MSIHFQGWNKTKLKPPTTWSGEKSLSGNNKMRNIEKLEKLNSFFWIAGIDVAMGLEICWPRERHRPVSDVVVAISKCWGYPMTNTKPRPMLAHQLFVQGAPQLCFVVLLVSHQQLWYIYIYYKPNKYQTWFTINIYKLWTQQILKLMFPNIAIPNSSAQNYPQPSSSNHSNPCPGVQSGWRLWPLHWAVCDTSSHSCHFEGACSVHVFITIESI